MKIALFGGAFNPPHLGHVMIARQILDFTDVDQLWFLPNYKQSPPKPVEDVSHRLAMTRYMKMDKTHVSTLEIDHKTNGQTINLLPYLPKEHSYTFIIGSDQLPTFHLWGKWEELLEVLPFYVFPRYGFPNEPLYKNMKEVRHRLLIASNLSSTKIRERVKAGLSVKEYVPSGVGEYIQKHKLYR